LLEILLAVALIALVLALPTTVLVLSIVAFVRSGRIKILEQRVEHLEARVQGTEVPPLPPEPVEGPAAADRAPDELEEIADAEIVTPVAVPSPAEAWQLEMLIGQKAFGWIAVVLGFFSAAFFLKYAYDNSWIGPLGRVAIGALAGSALLIAGRGYHGWNWRLFSQMLSSCGVVVLYLATYSAFGFYHLLPAFEAAAFLAVIIGLSMMASVLYDSPAMAFTAVLGGLVTPILLPADFDAYVTLFTYLTALNLGVAVVVLLRGWPAIGSLALVGTQVLYWIWYESYYHPEKLPWAIGFQAIIFALYMIQDLAVQFRRGRGNRWESTIRMVMNAVFWFTAFYILLEYDFGEWMGIAALGMATLYALNAYSLLTYHGRHSAELLTAIALSVGFIALAIPLEADARWVSLGWAACAGVLWWFGVRIDAAPLRGLAALIALGSMMRLLIIDLAAYPREMLIPIVNKVALPSMGVAACLLIAVLATRLSPRRLGAAERMLVGIAGLLVVGALWLVLSVDVYQHFHMRARFLDSVAIDWRRIGQMSLSVLWTLYASVLLAIGFRWRVSPIRWLAICFYALTVGKVFLLDMAGLSEIYRIVAFIVLAVFLGIAARFYQRLGLRRDTDVPEEASFHVRS